MQADVTRVITFQLARETSNRTYPEIGVPDPHHPLTHRGNDPEKIAGWQRSMRFTFRSSPYFLEKFKGTPEGDGTLLDHSLYLYGSGMGNPNVHDHVNLPILVAGGGATGVKGGRHIKYAEPTPLANLHVTLLDVSVCVWMPLPTAKARLMNCCPCSFRLQPEGCAMRSIQITLLLPLFAATTLHAAPARTPLADAAEKMDRAEIRALLKQHAASTRRSPMA